MKKYFVLFLTSLLGLLPIIPSLGSIDMIAPYYFFIAIFQIFISVSLIKINKDQITFNLIDLFYLGFLFVSLLSFIKSFNLNESLIEWIQYLTLFLTYFNLKILFSSFDNGKTILINVLCVILSVETLVIIYQFILGYSFVEGIDRVKALQGLSSNLNIGASSSLLMATIIFESFIPAMC